MKQSLPLIKFVLAILLALITGAGLGRGASYGQPVIEPPAYDGYSGIKTIVATAFSSKMNRVGEPVQVFLSNATTTPEGTALPSGTRLYGKIAEILYNKHRDPAGIRLLFLWAQPPGRPTVPIRGVVAGNDGVLTAQSFDIYTPSPNRSYATLKFRIRAILSSDQAVWNQVLGVNQSPLVDYESDSFMEWYNRHAVLIGVGDTLRLRLLPLDASSPDVPQRSQQSLD